MKKETIVVLDNIRSVHNVGSVFRTAEAAGVSHLILCGTTPTPIDRFGRARKDLAKVALGTEKTLAWSYETTTVKAVKKLKKEKFQIVALEQAEKAVDYKKIKLAPRAVIIIGEETKGLTAEILKLADFVAEIPMRGEKESLNVSVAFGVVIFRLIEN